MKGNAADADEWQMLDRELAEKRVKKPLRTVHKAANKSKPKALIDTGEG